MVYERVLTCLPSLLVEFLKGYYSWHRTLAIWQELDILPRGYPQHKSLSLLMFTPLFPFPVWVFLFGYHAKQNKKTHINNDVNIKNSVCQVLIPSPLYWNRMFVVSVLQVRYVFVCFSFGICVRLRGLIKFPSMHVFERGMLNFIINPHENSTTERKSFPVRKHRRDHEPGTFGKP